MELKSALRTWGSWNMRGENRVENTKDLSTQLLIKNVDEAVKKLPDEAKKTITEFYTKPDTIAEHADNLGVDRVRFYESLLYAEYLLEGIVQAYQIQHTNRLES